MPSLIDYALVVVCAKILLVLMYRYGGNFYWPVYAALERTLGFKMTSCRIECARDLYGELRIIVNGVQGVVSISLSVLVFSRVNV